jgi:hypothetical protein
LAKAQLWIPHNSECSNNSQTVSGLILLLEVSTIRYLVQ